MKTFRDTAGREWCITVDVNAVKRVMKAPIEFFGEPLRVNLLSLVEPNCDLLKKMADYPPLICDVVYALCKPQCNEKNVTDEEFGRAMGGDVLQNVLECLIEETIDFFPEYRRKFLRKVLEKGRAFDLRVKEMRTTRLNSGELDAAIDQILETEWQKLSILPTNGTGSVGSLPALSGSIPGQEPLPN